MNSKEQTIVTFDLGLYPFLPVGAYSRQFLHLQRAENKTEKTTATSILRWRTCLHLAALRLELCLLYFDHGLFSLFYSKYSKGAPF